MDLRLQTHSEIVHSKMMYQAINGYVTLVVLFVCFFFFVFFLQISRHVIRNNNYCMLFVCLFVMIEV